MVKIDIQTEEGHKQYTSELSIYEIIKIIERDFPNNLGFMLTCDNQKVITEEGPTR